MKKNFAQLIQKVTGIIEPPFHRGAIRAAKLKTIYSVFLRIALFNNFDSISVCFAIPLSANVAACSGMQFVEFGFRDWCGEVRVFIVMLTFFYAFYKTGPCDSAVVGEKLGEGLATVEAIGHDMFDLLQKNGFRGIILYFFTERAACRRVFESETFLCIHAFYNIETRVVKSTTVFAWSLRERHELGLGDFELDAFRRGRVFTLTEQVVLHCLC